MDIPKFSEDLKKLRLEKQVSLMDISFSTRINIRFLEAIEAGKFSILPQTYVRAFLREYGEAIGLGADEILRRYDALREPGGQPVVREAPAPARTVPTPSVKQSEPAVQRFSVTLKKNILFAGVLLAGVAFVLLLRSPGNKGPEPAREIPFDTVVKESEASTYKPDTVARAVVLPPVLKADSLHLEIATTDSVWISILVDGKTTLEYLFPPNRKRTFTAKDKFSITMGNAGGASFKLNGKELGSLGKRGVVVRNVIINEARLKSL
ncbi:MAG TPA: RodZ domain-containing protein [Bacteroidota bacterium]